MSSIRRLRMLLVSTGAHVNSGYGKTTRYLLRLMSREGMDVIAYNAQLFGGTIWMEGVLNVPCLGSLDAFCRESCELYYRIYDRNLLMTIWDVWVLDHIARLAESGKVTWFPIVLVDSDLDEHTYEINNVIRPARWLGAHSMYSAEQLRKIAPEKTIFYVPIGVDAQRLRPDEELRREGRAGLGIREDEIVFLYVAANIGDRKGFPELIEAFSILLDECKDMRNSVRLVLWTDPRPVKGWSYDLRRLAKRHGVLDRIVFPQLLPPTVFYDDEALAAVYNAADVYVSPSRAESFGMPVVEAMACGLPTVLSAYHAHVEFHMGEPIPYTEFKSITETPYGILVPVRHEHISPFVPTHQIHRMCDPHELAEAMKRMLNRDLSKYRERCRQRAMEYEWERVWKAYWLPAFERIAEELRD